MSRIQNILDKADRGGAARRIHPLTEPAGATLAVDVPPLPSSSAAVVVEQPAPAAAAVRTARSQLDRVLVAALAPGAFAAEQYRALRTRVAHSDHGAPVDVI